MQEEEEDHEAEEDLVSGGETPAGLHERVCAWGGGLLLFRVHAASQPKVTNLHLMG